MDLTLFKKIVEINSIYPNEEKLWDFLYNHLIELWFVVKKQYLNEKYCENELDKSRFNIIAEKWEWNESLLFYAHMDTVPVHDKSIWKTNPFELCNDFDNKDIYYWLGTVDMKWWLFSILESIKWIDINWYKLKVVFWVDEEYWSKWSYSLIESDFLDDVKLAIVPELWNSENIVKWVQNIILWRRWRYIIKLDVPGKSCHWANALEHWINAITQASIIAKEIDENYQITKNFNNILIWNQFVKYFHSSVSSLSVPDLATIYIDRHIVPWEDENSVIIDIENIINKLYNEWKLKLVWNQKVNISFYDRPTPASKSYVVDENSIYVNLIKESVLKYYEKYNITYWFSVADENVIANYKNIPVITLWPVWGNEHWANEWVDVKSIEKLINIYKEIIINFWKF